MKKNLPYFLVFGVLALLSWMVWRQRSAGTLKVSETAFGIQDTASVVRIFLADRKGKQLTLERPLGAAWTLNQTKVPRPDAVKTILETLHRWEVKTPVPRPAVQTVFRNLATLGVKVEVYLANKEKRVYYVGSGTPDMRGTYAMLEGSELPYVLHLPGWEGYLSTRFFTDEEEMRERVLFRLRPDSLARLVVEYPYEPLESYEILRQPDGGMQLRAFDPKSGQSGPELKPNPEAVASLWQGFGFLPVEGFENNQPMRDSVPSRVPEKMRVRIWEKSGRLHLISVYPKSQLNQLDVVLLNVAPDLDRDYFYHHGMNDFGVLQRRAIPWFYARRSQLTASS